MSKPTAETFLSVIPKLKAPEPKKRSTVEFHGKTLESGWDVVGTAVTFAEKPDRKTWNRKDVIWFFKSRYNEMFGQSIQVPIIAGYQWLQAIAYGIFKQTGIECTDAQLADFIDFCFRNHVNQLIHREGPLSLQKLTRPKFIIDYCKSLGLKRVEPPAKTSAPSTEVEELTLDLLTGAFRIGSKYFVSVFGVVLPVNFLMYVKKKTRDEAFQYVKNALAKTTDDSPSKATAKYGPYPTWLAFLNAEELVPGLKVATVNADDKYGFLRSK